ITTRDHANEKIGIVCSAGSFNLRDCTTSLFQRHKQLIINASLSAHHTDNYRQHNTFDQQSLLGNIKYDYFSGQIKFHFNVMNEYMQYPGALSSQQAHQNRRQATNSTDYFKNWNNFFHWQQTHALHPMWNISTDIAYRQMNGK